MASQQNLIVGYVGKKGSGKSYALKKFLGSKGTGLPRIVVFDVRSEYDFIPNRIEADLDDLRDFLDDNENKERFAVAYIPASPRDEIDEFCELVFEYEHILAVFEEVPAYSSAGSMPEGFERLTLQARHRNLDIAYTSQRFAECPRSLTAQTDAFVLFASREPRDIEALISRVGEETAKQVATLPLHSAITYDVEQGESREGMDVPHDRLASTKFERHGFFVR